MTEQKAVQAYLQSNFDRHLERLKEFLRQPSISAEDLGVRECAELLRQYLSELGFHEAQLIPTDGHPGVWGYFDAGAKRMLVVYGMYDVQPVAGENWSVPPFGAQLVDMPPFGRVLINRGVYNTKGPLIWFLNAVEAIQSVTGTLPVNLMLVVEGEEELGSPHMPQIIDRYAERLKTAHGVFFPAAAQDRKGRVNVTLGNKGIVYLELECSGEKWGRGPKAYDVHSSFKAVVDSPVWRLIHALATMTSEDGNTITIDGWYDKVAAPLPEDEPLLDELAQKFDPETWREVLQVDVFINDETGKDLLRRYTSATTLNIDGIWGGYTGAGTKTVLPHKVTAKLDIRLVPNQEPNEMVALLKRHLEKHGFSDIEVRVLNAYPWSRTPLTAGIVQALLKMYRDYGVETLVFPTAGGSAPMYLFTRVLGLPEVGGGLGHGGRAHSPDEYLVIDGNEKIAGMVKAEQWFADFLFSLKI